MSSQWGIQHVKIELENDQGERLVINQDPGGRVTCNDPARATKPAAAAKPAASKQEPGEPAKPKTQTAPHRGAKPEPAKATKPEAAKTTKPEAAKTAKPKSEGRKPGRRKATSLEWKPVKDAGYYGFAAKSEGGAFKLLKAKNSQWALFFERPGQKTVPHGCFKEEAPGRVKAQELHDGGTHRVEPEPITEYRIINVCPIDPDEPAAPEPVTPVAPTTPDEAEPIAPNAEMDAEMMASLKRALAEV